MILELRNAVDIISTLNKKRESLALAAKRLREEVKKTCEQLTTELGELRGDQPPLVVNVTPLLSAALQKAPPRWSFQVHYQGECLLRVDCIAKGDEGAPIATIASDRRDSSRSSEPEPRRPIVCGIHGHSLGKARSPVQGA